jgi:hypothetical protein
MDAVQQSTITSKAFSSTEIQLSPSIWGQYDHFRTFMSLRPDVSNYFSWFYFNNYQLSSLLNVLLV